ncbi:hypothetical protein IEQ34_005647 [Dendrobium chrysotoxum]|uniref:WAT1-related protein n=1 Tax=Dendrobium chrysotoxum TaxID=161865 RepID=A0AAV7HCU3_DENCH|nr:hypothetical protein IEQ34_005647 [Dendrobium chrysotoxum]
MGDEEGGNSSWTTLVEGMKPAMGMVVIQFVFAGINIFNKLAINDGMNMRILVAYRYLFATASLAPFAFILERKSRPKLTWKILMQAFFSGLFGATLAQNLYVSSIKLTSATFASAMTNLVPAITFIMAVIFRLEHLRIRTKTGQAKILGTLVGVFGATILTFLKGKEINLPTNVNLLKSHSNGGNQMAAQRQEYGNRVMGSIMSLGSCFSYAFWLIIQAKMSKDYPCHYSSTAIMCLMGSVQSIIFALCMERNWEDWHMGLGIRLYSAAYTGAVGSGPILSLLAWCINKKGPLYASVFNPLMLVIVAIFGSLLLDEKLHIGSIIGAVLIVIGLYLVLWGKGKEAEATNIGKYSTDKETIDVVGGPKKIELQNGSALSDDVDKPE